MREFFYATLLVLGIVCGAVGLVVGISFSVGPPQCAARSISFEDHKWGFWSRCMVKHEGEWVPLANFRFIEKP